MNCTPKLSNCKQQVEGPRKEYAPPFIATLVSARSRRIYRWEEEWLTPPGWSPTESLLDQTLYLSIRPGLMLRELGDSLVIHEPLSVDRHCLNDTAAFLFFHSCGIHTPLETALAYAREYGLRPRQARADARRILAELLEKKILVLRPKKTYPAD
jgi:hypothetical protein